jgi:hypothetical protein
LLWPHCHIISPDCAVVVGLIAMLLSPILSHCALVDVPLSMFLSLLAHLFVSLFGSSIGSSVVVILLGKG